jgi:pyrroline-5-carboxylate reductase
MTEPTLCFIGAGNMASAMIGGLIAGGFAPSRIIACDIDATALQRLADQFGIVTEQDARQAAQSADGVILAVKPQVMQQVCSTLANIPHQPLFISIAAGVRSTDIDRWLGGNRAVARCMPNTPALVRLGASGLFANDRVDAVQQKLAESIMHSTGVTVWVDDETQLDAVTAISGSGPAYFFLFIEALQQAGLELGLEDKTAQALARQTALGAATMALDADVQELRRKVTSPGGTTEQAIASFTRDGLGQCVARATRAAYDRSIELADVLARDD